jgi:glycosyltransferase 2 family protein
LPGEGRVLRSGRFWIGLIVSAVFIGLLFFKTDREMVIDSLRHANWWWLSPAVALYFGSVWVRALRYRYIVRSVKPISASALFPVLIIGYMANNLLPARAGEFFRAHVLGEKYHVSKMAALGTVAVERLFDGLTLLGFLAVTVVLLGGDGALKDLTLIAVAVFAIALATFISALAAPDATEQLIGRLSRLVPGRFRTRAYDLAIAFVEGLRSLRHPDAFIWVTGSSIAAWMLEAVVYMLVGRAFGFDINFGYYIMAVGAGNLANLAPTSQGGIGPFEFFTKQVLVGAAVAEADAAAYGFAVHATILVPATILGLYYLWSMGLSLNIVRRRDEPVLEPVPVRGTSDD